MYLRVFTPVILRRRYSIKYMYLVMRKLSIAVRLYAFCSGVLALPRRGNAKLDKDKYEPSMEEIDKTGLL